MVNDTVTQIGDPLVGYWDRFVNWFPQLISALVVLIIGLIIASIIAGIVSKVISLIENDKRVKQFLSRWNIKIKVGNFVSKFTWWIVFLVFLSASAHILDITVLTDTINAIVGFMPALFAAAAITVLALVAAGVVRSLVVSALEGVKFKPSRLVGTIVYAAVLVFGFTLAAAQLGLDTTLITANITVVVAGIVFGLAIAFGVGSYDLAGSLVAGLTAKDMVKKGQKLTVNGMSGKVVEVNATGVVIETSEGDKVVSYRSLLK